DLLDPTAQDLDPVEPAEAVGQGLRPSRVLELGEGVVVLHEADAGVVELPGEPVVAVEADLGGEGEPGLDADVPQPELLIEEVEVQDALRPAREDQSGPVLAVAELDGAAVLLAAQDTNQALAEAALADVLLDEVFLAVLPLEVDVGGAVPLGELL